MEKTEEKEFVYMGTKEAAELWGVNRIKKVLLGEYQEMSAAQEKKRVSKGEKIWESQRKYYQLYLH